jgi:hypothetical protein
VLVWPAQQRQDGPLSLSIEIVDAKAPTTLGGSSGGSGSVVGGGSGRQEWVVGVVEVHGENLQDVAENDPPWDSGPVRAGPPHRGGRRRD